MLTKRCSRIDHPGWRMAWLVLVLLATLMLAGCAASPAFVPPDERARNPSDAPWPKNTLLALAYHDVTDGPPDQTFLSVSTDQLINQLAWLRENGFVAVSVDAILAAQAGGDPLPERAVLLTFDDGYRSFYERVFPVLKAYQWPAVLAPVGAWTGTPRDQPVNFGGLMVERDRFTVWPEIREMAQSGLVEMASHTNNLHFGVPANPQGNQQPAAASLIYDKTTGTYETPAAYRERIARDAAGITATLERVTGKPVRVWVWPYGAANGAALRVIGNTGYTLALTLDDGAGKVNELMSMPRALLSNAPELDGFARLISGRDDVPSLRVAHVDLDYLYDPDPAQMDRNLGKLVQRIADLQISTVFLQAYADPVGDGLVRSVYFPNRVLPMRADLFNRVAWQLRSRAAVRIYAWMPVLSLDLDPSIARVTRWNPDTPNAMPAPDPAQYRRLSPFDPQARELIGQLYEDLAFQATFDGILFHDDALLSDFEDAGPLALKAYEAAGLPGSVAALRADPDTLQRWTRFKSRYLVDFTLELAERVRAIRGPQVKTARNIFAMPILEPHSETWFAQNLDDFLTAYDWTAPMAMPYMEGVPARDATAWLERLVDAVAQRRPGALNRTVFELQSRDWSLPEAPYIDSAVLAGWMRTLQKRGALSFGYYPDDFIGDHPAIQVIRPALSNAWYPYP